MKKVILGFLVFVVQVMAIEIGKVPNAVIISDDKGGKTDGTAWHSSDLKGKVHVVFYVDPDKKDDNNGLSAALKKRHFDRKKYASVAIVNLAATWLPNALIESKLKEKQKEFPDTTYVKDKKKILVKEWGLADDNSDILVFDKKGKLIYKKFGKVPEHEIKDIITLIEENI